MNADYIVVQEEKYKKLLDSTIPQKNFLALGFPKFDKIICLCQNPPEPRGGYYNDDGRGYFILHRDSDYKGLNYDYFSFYNRKLYEIESGKRRCREISVLFDWKKLEEHGSAFVSHQSGCNMRQVKTHSILCGIFRMVKSRVRHLTGETNHSELWRFLWREYSLLVKEKLSTGGRTV